MLLGQLLSISALALEEFSFRRHPRGREILRMMAYAAIENLGYRQLTDLWRGVAFWDLLRRKRSWGDMQRRGFQTAPTDQCAALGSVREQQLFARGADQHPAARGRGGPCVVLAVVDRSTARGRRRPGR